MEKQSYKIYTPEEYLVLEEAAEYKSEYYLGEIFAISGGSVNHIFNVDFQMPLKEIYKRVDFNLSED